MKNQIYLLLMLPVLAAAVTAGCGALNRAGVNNGNTNAAESNRPRGNADDKTAELNKIAAEFLELPSPKPVENAKKQSYTGITIDVPADWKALPKVDRGTSSEIGFQSPEGDSAGLRVAVGRSYEKVDGDMQATYSKNLRQKLFTKLMMREINGTLGVLYADLKNDSLPDFLTWETFPPPDAKGYALKRYVQFNFPNGAFEQNKQRIADILFTAKVGN